MRPDEPLRIPAAITGQPFTLFAADGYPLAANWFPPDRGPARGTVIIHGATATPAAYYRRFARFAASRGLRVLTYDYRGVGGSRPPALAHARATMTDWARLDARAAHRVVRERFPNEPVAIIGHSFGGQLLGLVDEARDVRAALLVGAQLGYFRNWPSRLYQLWLQVSWRALVPLLTRIYGYLPGRLTGLGEDLPAGVAREWARWCSRPDYYMGDHPDARDRLASFDRPLRLYSFTDDSMAPPRAVAQLLSCLRAAALEHERIDPRDHGGDPIGHFGFFRPRCSAQLWPAAVEFLIAHCEGRGGRTERSGHFRISQDVMADLEYGQS